MNHLIALTGMAVVLFAATNIDDIFVLVGFFADSKLRTREIVLGQYAGIGALFCLSLAASLLSLQIPRAYVGLLGLIPIAIGGKRLFDLLLKRDRTEEELEHRSGAGRGARAITVAMVTIANGGDNIVIYVPSFAYRTGYELALVALVFAVMIALWCSAAYAMVHHPRLGSPLRRYGQWLTPIALIGLGMMILYQAGTFAIVYRR